MSEHSNQPREFDAVLGGQVPPPQYGAVLGDFARSHRNLKNFLEQGMWQQADLETTVMMLKLANRTDQGSLSELDINNFDCEKLQIINNLWLKNSNGRFGFSVQKQIWQAVSNTSEPDWDAWCRFGESVGWYVNEKWLYWNDVTFNLKAPAGHLPRGGALMGWGLGDFWTGCRKMSALAEKLDSCGII